MNLLRNDIDALIEVKDEIEKLEAAEDTKLEKLENQNIFYRSLFLNKKFPTKRYRYFPVTVPMEILTMRRKISVCFELYCVAPRIIATPF